MRAELTLAAIALVIFIALLACGIAGLVIALLWSGVGLWMVSQSASRGFAADALFILTWPLHWLLER